MMSITTTPQHFEQFAKRIANIFAPPVIALPVLFVIAIGTASPSLSGLIWWFTTTICLSLIPFGFILLGVRRGRYHDIHLFLREQRIIPLFAGLGAILVTCAILVLEHASRVFFTTIISIFVGTFIATLITFRWKVSFHVAAITGAVTVLALIFGPVFLWLTPLIFLVAWSRRVLLAHTIAQMLVGAMIASAVPWSVFHIVFPVK
jgi:hypothetical protein